MRNLLELLVPKSIKKAVKRIALCYISRSKIMLVTYPDKVVKEFDFPKTTVSDGDVVNKEEYRTAIASWAHENSLKVSDMLFVISENLVFTKDIRPDGRMRQPPQEIINSFVEVVPYQRVYVSKIINKDGTIRVIVTNRDIIYVIMRAFEALGFVSLGAFPELSVINNSMESINNQNTLDLARKHIDILTLHQYSQNAFHTSDVIQKPITQMSVSEAAKQPINPFVAAAIVSLIVVFVLGVAYWRFEDMRKAEMVATQKRIEELVAKQNQLNSRDSLTQVTANANTIPATPTVTTPKIRIQVIYTSSSARGFELIKSSLTETYGYEVVGETTQNESIESRILTNTTTQDFVTRNIQRVLETANISMGGVSKTKVDDYDVVVTLGRIIPSAPIHTTSPTP